MRKVFLLLLFSILFVNFVSAEWNLYDSASADNVAANFNSSAGGGLYTFTAGSPGYYLSGNVGSTYYSIDQKNNLSILAFNSTFYMTSAVGTGNEVVFSLGEGTRLDVNPTSSSCSLSSLSGQDIVNHGYFICINRARNYYEIYSIENQAVPTLLYGSAISALTDGTFYPMNLSYDGSTLSWNVGGNLGSISNSNYTLSSSTGFKASAYRGGTNGERMGIKNMYISPQPNAFEGTVSLISPENESTLSDTGENFTAFFNMTGYSYDYTWDNATFQVWKNQTQFNFTSVNLTGNNTNYTLFIDNFVLGDYEWNVYGCYGNSTFKNCTYASDGNFSFSVVPFSVLAESYSPNVLEGDTSTFSINISIITFARLSTAAFYYNGTSYTATATEYETNKWYFTIDKQIPQVDGIDTVEFYWNVVLESGFTQNSTIHNQTISEIQIDDCSTYTTQILNFTIVDESTQDFINGASGNTSLKIDLILSYLDDSSDVVQYSHFFDEINPARVCMNNSIGNSSLNMNAVVEYSASGKFVEFYNIQNYVFNSTTVSQNITLYNLASDEGQEFRITYKGEDFIPVTDLILQIQRKYIDEGVFKTVEIPMSGTNGYTIAHLVPNDVIYNLIFIKDGSILDTFAGVVADCQNPDITECEINLNSLITGLDLFNIVEDNEFSSSLTFDKDTREVSSTFAILSGVSGKVNLNVTLMDNFGNNTACTDSLTAAGGTLSCTVPDSFGNSTIYAKVVYNGKVKHEGYISMSETPKVQYKGILIFSSIIVLFLIFGIGLSDNPYLTAVFFIVGALLLVGLNLFYSTSWLGAGATILWFVFAVIAIIMKGGNKR